MIVVRSNLQNSFEDEYIINFILPNSKNIINTSPENFFNIDKSIVEKSKILIIYSPSSEEIFNEIDSLLKNISYKYSIIHLSDENLEGPYSHYDKAEVILRSYFNPRLNHRKCYTIPLGFQSGFLENNYQFKYQREYIWSFCGQDYSTRVNMIENLKPITPNFIHKTNTFMADDALGTNELKKIYKNTYFAPCPFGFRNPDTFRIMEVLESGCIPVVKKMYRFDYFKLIFGDHPFIVLNKWKSIGETILKYQSNPEILEKKQQEVWDWYAKFKMELSLDAKNLLSVDNYEVISKQFNYQQKN